MLCIKQKFKNLCILCSRLIAEYLKCLNRGDIGHELFKKKIGQNHGYTRRNLNRLIHSNDTHIFCNQNQTIYRFDELCERAPGQGKNFKKPCLLDTGDTMEL